MQALAAFIQRMTVESWMAEAVQVEALHKVIWASPEGTEGREDALHTIAAFYAWRCALEARVCPPPDDLPTAAVEGPMGLVEESMP